MTLDHGIGVRIPASQPLWSRHFPLENPNFVFQP